MASLTLVSASSTPLLTAQEAKEHCRVDLDDENNLLVGYVEAATQHVQNVTGRQFLAATYELRLDGWPCWIDVPRPPLVSVTSVKYIDSAGDEQTLAAEQYLVSKPVGPTAARGRIERAYSGTWPTLRCEMENVRIQFVAGYGTEASAVPAGLRQAVAMLVAHWYRNRETVNIGNITSELPLSVKALAAPFKTWSLQVA